MEKVCVLQSTYNGKKYLKEQIDSILNQENVDVQLIVRDDGSNDSTPDILSKYSNDKRIIYSIETNIGPAKSFLQLLKNAPASNYYAFSDQDDIWDKDKLYCAIEKMKGIDSCPCLYFSTTESVDENLNTIKTNNIKPKLTFGESLIYAYASGCTMVMNNKLHETILSYQPEYIPMHDYLIISVAHAVGAKIVFDETPHIKYRQHNNNVIGAQQSFYKKWKERFNRIFIDKTCARSRMANEIYKGYHNIMPAENIKLLSLYLEGKDNFTARLRMFFSSQLSCSDKKTLFLFKIATILNRY